MADNSFLEAAIREVHEESGLDLSEMVQSGKIHPKHCYTYEDVGEMGIHYKTVVFHFDLGKDLARLRIAPHDDLQMVKKIKLADIQHDPGVNPHRSFFVKEDKVRLKGSNGLLLNKLFENTLTEEAITEVHQLMKIEHDGYELLITALMQGKNEEVYKLLDAGVPIEPKEKYAPQTPLQLACEYGRLEIVKLLIEKGVKTDQGSPLPISCALKNKHFDIVLYLIENSQIDPYQLKLVLAEAAGLGQIHIVEYLLNRGVNVNEWHHMKDPPLAEAVAAGNREMAEFLLHRGADVNIANDIGELRIQDHIVYSPLMMAIKNGNQNLLQFLIDNQAEINGVFVPGGQYRYDAISWAIYNDQQSIAQMLIKQGGIRWSDHPKTQKKALELARKKGWNAIAAEIACQQMIQAIHHRLSINASLKVSLDRDEQGEPTIVIHFQNKEYARLSANMLGATLRNSNEGFYIRVGKIRLGKLFSNAEQGKIAYHCMTIENDNYLHHRL